jgi:hypothetical protein
LSSTATAEFSSKQQAEAFIVGQAYASDLDPAAVVAVAQTEGLGGLTGPIPAGHYDPDQQGDPGWSYGPFQLRDPGALPSTVYSGTVSSTEPGPQGAPEQWAWSPTGVQYAINQIQAVAAGKTGQDAIDSIVGGFEHPADPSAEEQSAGQYYQRLTAGGSGSPVQIPNTPTPDLHTPVGNLPLAPGGGINVKSAPGSGGADTTTSPTGSQATGIFSWTADPVRILQLAFGGLLILLGLYLLVRRSGAVPSVVPA